MTSPKLELHRNDGDKVIRMSVDAADGIAARLNELERENERLTRLNETLDCANRLLAGERDRLKRQVDALQPEVANLKRKVAELLDGQRTPEQNESLADQIESRRSHS